MADYTPHVYRAPPPTISRGTVLLDFGMIPSPEAFAAVTGQDGILPTSHVHIAFQGDSNVNNDENEHIMAGQTILLTVGTPVVDQGFTIYAESSFALWTSRFTIRWSWWN